MLGVMVWPLAVAPGVIGYARHILPLAQAGEALSFFASALIRGILC